MANKHKIVRSIAVGGSAANPPHLGHKALVEALLNCNKFDKIMWIPSGVRPDKTGFIDPKHRVKMTELTLPKNDKLIINLADVYGQNNPTIIWLEFIQALGQGRKTNIVWYTGIDSVIPLPEHNGKCEIEQVWIRWHELIKDFKFLIIPRAGYPHPSEIDIPLKNYEILDVELPNICSTQVRKLAAEQNPWLERLVTPQVAKYIFDNKLY